MESLIRFRSDVEKLKDKYIEYGDSIEKFVITLDEIIIYINRTLRRYWLESVADEIIELIERMRRGDIIISNSKSISIEGDKVTINMNNTGVGTIYQIWLKGFHGIHIDVPQLIPDPIKIQFQIGLLNTDGKIQYNHPSMGTAQVWQVITWLLSFPGKTYVYLGQFDVNKSNVKPYWVLSNLDQTITEKPQLLGNDDDIIAFFSAILGDGTISFKRDRNKIYPFALLTGVELKMWEDMLRRLKYEYNVRNQRTASLIILNTFNTVAIFKRVYETIAAKSPLLLDILNIMRVIDDAEKIRRFMRVARYNEEIREVGKYSVNIVGRNFAVVVTRIRVTLECKIKDDSEAKRVIEALRSRYGEITIHKYGPHIVIPAYSIMEMMKKDDQLRRSIVSVLCQRLVTANDEVIRRRIHAFLREVAPTEGAAAAFGRSSPPILYHS